MAKRRANREGDDCERYQWQMKRAKRSGSRADSGYEHMECSGSAMRVDIKTVSEMLSRFSAGFTLDTCAHLTTAAQRAAADTQNRVLSGRA